MRPCPGSDRQKNHQVGSLSLQNLLADKVGSWVTVIIGVIVVLCVLAFRKGVIGELQAFSERRRHAATNADQSPGFHGPSVDSA